MLNRPVILLLIMCVGVTGIMLATNPLPQDPAYHRFIDQRELTGIPNFWNVISNLPYLAFGLIGLAACLYKLPAGCVTALRSNYLLLFIGTALVGPGSAWYHLAPDNASLLWDRIPIAITFMAFFSLVIGEYISVKAGRYLLWPLILIGILSVVYWQLTELLNQGDLRPYAIVQFLPMLLIPLIMLRYRSPFTSNRGTWWLMTCYLLAKVCEIYDAGIFRLTDMISGHTLKHLVSATGVLLYYIGLAHRSMQQEIPGSDAYRSGNDTIPS